MPIRGLNHAVLYVRDAQRSAAFYRDVLGFREIVSMPNAVFMRAPESDNDHDLGLFGIGDAATASPAGRSSVGLYHLAWEVPTLADLSDHLRRLADAGALVGASDHGSTKALYAKDPDGLEFEVSWLVPHELLGDDTDTTTRRLDLDAEIERYGADRVGALSRVPGTARA
ncbi:VOC family protein [Actinoallomurus bryophytorum]|uniref:Glyoxalase/bleomycin resistance protein/dioxygenase superfamily protein n=1 Tax=Actinoallomurus bryophytorum TaxID=1490222 RepID=A0A543CLQ7_9ACTN|nr:glyoxalase/bleomycin resistance protein/dioxygenase superfamily protein [Actinoallomurus bryophytorum]